MPVKETLDQYELLDIPIIHHGFAAHMRDYQILVEQNQWPNHAKGRYLFTFTHCAVASVVSVLNGDRWQGSWDDVLLDYKKWEEAGHPAGYVWGVCWANTYPGLTYISDSELVRLWSDRTGHSMHEVVIETNVFRLQLVFHDVRVEKVGDGSDLADRMKIPLQNK